MLFSVCCGTDLEVVWDWESKNVEFGNLEAAFPSTFECAKPKYCMKICTGVVNELLLSSNELVLDTR